MPTNKNVLIDREKYVGGSEISTILGINPFRKRFDLLLEKAGLKENDFDGNEYTEYGNVMEEKIRSFINESEKDKFVEYTIAEEHDIISNRCNYDGINKTTVLEIKTTSQIHDTVDEYKYYLVQLLWGMKLSGLKKGKLAVYERPEDFNTEFNSLLLRTYEINIKDYKELLEQIDLAVEQFRIDLVKVKANPFITEEDLMPKDLVAKCNKIVEIEEGLLEKKKLEEQEKKLKEEVLELMTKYEIKTWITPNNIRFTRVDGKPDEEVEVTTYDEDKFRLENADLCMAYDNKLAEYKEVKTEIKKGRKGSLRVTLPKE